MLSLFKQPPKSNWTPSTVDKALLINAFQFISSYTERKSVNIGDLQTFLLSVQKIEQYMKADNERVYRSGGIVYRLDCDGQLTIKLERI